MKITEMKVEGSIGISNVHGQELERETAQEEVLEIRRDLKTR